MATSEERQTIREKLRQALKEELPGWKGMHRGEDLFGVNMIKDPSLGGGVHKWALGDKVVISAGGPAQGLYAFGDHFQFEEPTSASIVGRILDKVFTEEPSQPHPKVGDRAADEISSTVDGLNILRTMNEEVDDALSEAAFVLESARLYIASRSKAQR